VVPDFAAKPTQANGMWNPATAGLSVITHVENTLAVCDRHALHVIEARRPFGLLNRII
jgi:hypothetical protein